MAHLTRLLILLIIATAPASTQTALAASHRDDHRFIRRDHTTKVSEGDDHSYDRPHIRPKAPEDDHNDYAQPYVDSDDSGYGHRRVAAREMNGIDFIVALALGAGVYLLLRRRVASRA